MNDSLLEVAWRELEASVVTFRSEPVGTVAARDPEIAALNYDQVFTRDFAVSAVAFLLYDKPQIVRNFLVQTLALQSRDKHMDCFRPGRGLMPVSFKVASESGEERIEADFGEKAIARVAPVDAPLWWLYVLGAYVRATGDRDFAARTDVQTGMRLILDLALTTRFDMFPTLLVPDGSFMVDRRLGVYGHPMDMQALFYLALRSARDLLQPTVENQSYVDGVRERLGHLTYHLRTYYWLDVEGLSRFYRYQVEEYGEAAVNRFNVYPDSIPDWLFDWLPDNGGYFVANLGPARMDFRFFSAGNLLAILGSLADDQQGEMILNLIRTRWDDLVGHMPLKVNFPALEYASQNIRVNAVAPGAIETPINRSWTDDPDKAAQVLQHIPMGRAGTADEIGAICVFLASDEAAYITGQTLYVDGGLTLYPDFRSPWSSE